MGTTTYMQNKIWTHFQFYASGGANGAFKETLAPGKSFQIIDVRLHLSVAHASAEDFVIWVSNALGSAFNQIFISQAMLGVKEYLYQPDIPIIFNSDDHLIFSLFVKSATNIYGLQVNGWSVDG